VSAEPLDPALERVCVQMSQTEMQGEALTSRDYWLLALVTIAVPALLVLIGALL
jgi:hypothetical protein